MKFRRGGKIAKSDTLTCDRDKLEWKQLKSATIKDLSCSQGQQESRIAYLLTDTDFIKKLKIHYNLASTPAYEVHIRNRGDGYKPRFLSNALHDNRQMEAAKLRVKERCHKNSGSRISS
ncbi:hypothetical protein ANN_10140 [Periplaneta americana]|uniref:Uncharacterized protein n=1 Tax=Periplaneta americana TaxID=6978 RepID=A0ABQ8TQL2_PERAM|nr:hypothetical protein ANN_10140 [Periplaneta americana]